MHVMSHIPKAEYMGLDMYNPNIVFSVEHNEYYMVVDWECIELHTSS